jgi:DNA-directed RNA polymerase specialized sigma24 family protein
VESANKPSIKREDLITLLLDHSSALKNHISHELPTSLLSHVTDDDLLQETFIQAFCLIERYEPRDDGSFLAWLKRLADNQIRETIRAFERRKRGGGFRRREDPVQDSSGRFVALIDRLSDDGKIRSSEAAIR